MPYITKEKLNEWSRKLSTVDNLLGLLSTKESSDAKIKENAQKELKETISDIDRNRK